MTYIIPKSFGDRSGSVELADLDTNFDYLVTSLNTIDLSNITGPLNVTGSTAITGGLTVDTSTLVVDATNNRVGINQATPTYSLDVTGTMRVTGDAALTTLSGTTTLNAGAKLYGTDTGSIKAPGTVVQVVTSRVDTQTTYSVAGNVNGSEITAMRVTITPKFANSLILIQWQLHGEGSATHDYVYNVWKNGAVATGTYAGYNTASGNTAYSGIAQALPYEGDYSSTPFTQHMQFIDYPGVTTAVTYGPGVKDSYSSARTWYFNRALSAPQNGYEVAVSFVTAWEIAQ